MVSKKRNKYRGVMKLNRIELEQEAVLISAYCDIISNIMIQEKELSLIKLYVYSFLYNKAVVNGWIPYSAHDKEEIMYKCLSCLSGLFEEFTTSINYIIAALDILCSTNDYSIIADHVIYSGVTKEPIIPSNLNFIYRAIDESKKYTDRQFLKEVIHNV